MSPARHAGVGGILSIGTYLLTTDIYYSAAIGSGSVALDIDHIYEYCREWGIRDGFRRLFDQTLRGVESQLSCLYLWFHGWDIFLVLTALQIFAFKSTRLWFFLAGAGAHLVMDQFGNDFRPGTYFFTYRMWKGFRRDLLVTRASAPE